MMAEITHQQYKDLDFRYVLLKKNDKIPFQKDWQNTNNYPYNSIEIVKHDGNIGIIGGYGNLRIFDADKEEMAKYLMDKLPETFTVKTGSGGLHFYIKSNYTKNRIFVNEMGEFRADRYQVVTAGGIHPNGNKYEVLKDKPIAEIPAPIIEEIIKPYIRPEITQTMLKTSENEDTTRSAREFREVIKLISNGLDKETIFQRMGAFTKWAAGHPAYKELTYNKALAYLQEHKNIDTEIELISVKQAIENGVPEIKYIINPLVREGGITIIGGEPGAKKSMLAQYMSICISKGFSVFDKFEVQKKKVCYLDFENGYAVIVNRFHSLICGNFSTDKTDMENCILSVFNDIKLDDSKSKKSIQKIIDDTGADVFIVDSLVRCMVGEEDKATEVRKVFDNLKDFMAKGKTFIILHHTRKDNNRGMSGLRGSSDLGGMAEIVLMLNSSGENGKFTNVEIGKHRHLGIEATEKWGFMIDDEIFKDAENYLKLKYYDRSPEEQTKNEQCLLDLECWVDDNYKRTDVFKTNAAVEAMDKLGGYKRIMVSNCLKCLHTKKIIKNCDKRGYWQVE